MDDAAERERAATASMIRWAELTGAACGALWGAFFGFFCFDDDWGGPVGPNAMGLKVVMFALIFASVGLIMGILAAIGFRLITGKL
jgi:hypothetical protein